MPFCAKLAIFFAMLHGTLWLIRRFPHHPASQFAVKWHGPFPVHGESFSGFMARRSLYTFKWFCQVLVVFCAFWVLVSWRPDLGDTTIFKVFWFALPLLGGTLLLAVMLYGLSAIKHRWLGPNPRFDLYSESPEA